MSALPPHEPPGASYLAKDYAGFVELMFDRLGLTVPGWQERSPADLGVMLVELMAYAADYLSYYQDSVATEAYLGTALLRPSLRRHARLLDYIPGEGANARVWLAVESDDPQPVKLPAGWQFTTPPDPVLDQSANPDDWHLGRVVFESMHDAVLYQDRNRIALHSWGLGRASIRAGATAVTLEGAYPGLTQEVLIFEAADPAGPAGPPQPAGAGGQPATKVARPLRHAVRVTEASVTVGAGGKPVTKIRWARADAVPFALVAGADAADRSVVRGNLVLADNGTTIPGTIAWTSLPLDPGTGRPAPVLLRGSALAMAEPYDPVRALGRPAAEAFARNRREVLPCVRLREVRRLPTASMPPVSTGSTPSGVPVAIEWTERRDLISSVRFARDFVTDVNDVESFSLRFGDGELGRAQPNADLEVRYRVGGGSEANVGAGSISVILAPPSLFPMRVENPLPASGGEAAEPAAQIRRDAPVAFLDQDRAVSAADYRELALRVPGVVDAAVDLTWAGSRRTAIVYALPDGAVDLDEPLRASVHAFLSARRLGGVDMEIRGPRYVPLAIAIAVGLVPGYSRARVVSDVASELGTGELEGGRSGLFHGGSFGFGQPVYLGPIVARAAAVPGVAWVEARSLRRFGEPDAGELESARLGIGPFEIARVEGDPGRPELGLVTITVEQAAGGAGAGR
jgi:hypothetical protein